METAADPWAPRGVLRQALTTALERRFGARGRIGRLSHRPAVFRSSYPIEELEIELADATRLTLLFKDLSEPPACKPSQLHEPEREIRVYQRLLTDAGLDAPVCYGSVRDPRSGRRGLLLEKVVGVELFQVGAPEIWWRAAAWLARLHDRFAAEAGALCESVPLPRWDRAYCDLWPARALSLFDGGDEDRCALEDLVERYERVAIRLCELPVSLIHGEFYPANVLVREPLSAGRICPVDWEMAAVGPALIDLAALVGGRWPEPERQALALAYRRAAPAGLQLDGQEDFLQALDACRLHLALQWLGWSADFTPPPEQRHDWLGEALGLARRLGL